MTNKPKPMSIVVYPLIYMNPAQDLNWLYKNYCQPKDLLYQLYFNPMKYLFKRNIYIF